MALTLRWYCIVNMNVYYIDKKRIAKENDSVIEIYVYSSDYFYCATCETKIDDISMATINRF